MIQKSAAKLVYKHMEPTFFENVNLVS